MNITDDTRIRAAIPSIEYLVKNGAKVLACSHFGRPKSGPEDKFRLTPVGARLSELLSCPVTKIDDCIGPEVEKAVAGMSNGSVCLLENTRFYKEEEGNDAAFAKNLAGSAKIFVNDAFGTAHRAHASTAGVADHLSPCVCGLLIEKELAYLGDKTANPKRPLTVILGGAKVSDKIKVIDALLEKAEAADGPIHTVSVVGPLALIGALAHDDDPDAPPREKLATLFKCLSFVP